MHSIADLAATGLSASSSSACMSAEDPLRDSDSDASASAESTPSGLAEDRGSKEATTVPAGVTRDVMMLTIADRNGSEANSTVISFC